MREGRVRKTIIQIATLAALMFVTYYLIMRDKDFGQVWQVIASSSKIWFLVAAACMTLYIFCGGWAIRVLMKGRGKHVSIWQCFKYSFVEFYFSALTPSSSGGQPVQLIYMRKDGFGLSDSTVVLAAITALYKASFLIITAVLFLLNISFIAEPISSVWPLVIIGLVLNLGLIGILIMLLFSTKILGFFARKVISIGAKLHLVKDVEAKTKSFEKSLENYHECAKFFMENKLLVLKTLGVLALQRFSLLIIPYLVYRSFGLSGYTLLQILATQCLLNLCVEMMPLPGAVGISEAVFLMLFTPIFTEANVTTAVLLSRGISFYLMVIVAGIALMGISIAGIVRTNKKEVGETGN